MVITRKKRVIKVLTGVRRSGKSTILRMLREELTHRGIKEKQILFYRLDSLEYEDIKTSKELYKELKEHLYVGGKTYLFLDEVQEIESWEKVVNSMMTDFDVDIYVTGSNSRMMSSEISTYLTGRYVAFQIYPLRFSEYLLFRKSYTEIADVKTEFARFLRFGGFPAIHLVDYTQDTAAASFVDKTAKKGKKYSYRVRCITSNGKTYTSEMSAAKTITRE